VFEQIHSSELGDVRHLEFCGLQFRGVVLLPLGHLRALPRRLASLSFAQRLGNTTKTNQTLDQNEKTKTQADDKVEQGIDKPNRGLNDVIGIIGLTWFF
jgi:hypothetical protein